jgi:hypothetical protein
MRRQTEYGGGDPRRGLAVDLGEQPAIGGPTLEGLRVGPSTRLDQADGRRLPVIDCTHASTVPDVLHQASVVAEEDVSPWDSFGTVRESHEGPLRTDGHENELVEDLLGNLRHQRSVASRHLLGAFETLGQRSKEQSPPCVPAPRPCGLATAATGTGPRHRGTILFWAPSSQPAPPNDGAPTPAIGTRDDVETWPRSRTTAPPIRPSGRRSSKDGSTPAEIANPGPGGRGRAAVAPRASGVLH